MARLVFLGRLEDVAGMEELSLALEGTRRLEDLLAELPEPLVEALKGPRVRLALNGEILVRADEVTICDDDEVAFLPPVSGG